MIPKLVVGLPAVTLVIILINGPSQVESHGRLIEPPSRSSMWRYGFKTERNYNDNELFCGGYSVQWQRNGGKCGVCGDPWHQREPRNNEAGGKYAKGIIVRRYNRGQTMKATVQLTANHRGFFEFRLCPVNNPNVKATEECMAQNPLSFAEGGSGPANTRYLVPGGRSRDFPVRLQLPRGLTCKQCVLQWTYTAGNNWGKCDNGSTGVGCGPQETFRGCADISIDDTPHDPNDIDQDFNPPRPSYAPPTRRPTKAYPRPPPPTRRVFPSTTTRRPWWKTTTKSWRRPQYPTRRVYNRRPWTTTTTTTTTTTPRPYHEVEDNYDEDYNTYNTVVPQRPHHEIEGEPDYYLGGYTQSHAQASPQIHLQQPSDSDQDLRPQEVEGSDVDYTFRPVRPVRPGYTNDHTENPTQVPRKYTPWTNEYDTAESSNPTTKLLYTYHWPGTTKVTLAPRRRTATVEATTLGPRRGYVPNDVAPETPKKTGRTCFGVGVWKSLPGIEQWCVDNCSRGYCPASHCAC